MMNGHDLVKELVRKHGVNRYPTAELALLKLVEEVGELVQAHIKGKDIHSIAKEFADVGLVLYGIGNILNLRLEEEMLTVVNKDNRKFA